MRGAATRWAISLLLFISSGRAFADSSEAGDSLTLLPWNAASLVVSSKDTRAVVQLSAATDCGYRWLATASVPLDEDERVASFSSNSTYTPGIKLTAKFGWDSDRRVLLKQMAWLKKFKEVVSALRTPPNYALNGRQASYVKRKGLLSQDNATIWRDLGYPGGLSLNQQITLLEQKRIVVEGRMNAARCINSQDYDKATQAAKDEEPLDCFLRDWHSTLKLGLQNYARLEAITKDIPSRFLLPSELADQINNLTAQHVVTHLDEMWTLGEKLLEESAAANLGTALSTRPARNYVGHSVLLESSLSADNHEVYVDALDVDPTKTKSYDLVFGVDYTLLPKTSGLSLNLNAGYERKRENGAEEVERCKTPPSEDGAVSGKGCEKVLYRDGAQPDSESSAYARAAITYQPGGKPKEDGVLPGVEGRLAITGLFDDKRVSTRISLFGTPLKGNTAGRFGLAIDAAYDINRPGPDTGTRWEITTLVFIGASLADLNKL